MEKYKHFFEDISKFQNEQQKRKNRGLNDFNILQTVFSNISDEVRLHSRMIFSFLDINGTHYQSNLFLNKFLEVLDIDNFQFNTEKYFIYKEYKYIDLYLTDGKKHIIIENKIYADDQENQIQKYIHTIKNENSNLSHNDILVIYLTLDRKEPTPYSLGDFQILNNFIMRKSERIAIYKSIFYKTDILKWLNISQYEIQNITNLNEAFNQYIDIIKILNNQYKAKVMNLSDYILENKHYYKIANEIKLELPKVRKKIVENFFENIVNSLQLKLGNNWQVEINGNLSKRYELPFKIYKKEWNGSNNLIFGCEFEKSNYYDGYFGIVKNDFDIDLQTDIRIKFKSNFQKLDFNLKTTEWWLHWEYLPHINENKDFAEYIILYENSEKVFIEKILNMIKIFELQDDLISNINKYLNQSNNKDWD